MKRFALLVLSVAVTLLFAALNDSYNTTAKKSGQPVVYTEDIEPVVAPAYNAESPLLDAGAGANDRPTFYRVRKIPGFQ